MARPPELPQAIDSHESFLFLQKFYDRFITLNLANRRMLQMLSGPHKKMVPVPALREKICFLRTEVPSWCQQRGMPLPPRYPRFESARQLWIHILEQDTAQQTANNWERNDHARPEAIIRLSESFGIVGGIGKTFKYLDDFWAVPFESFQTSYLNLLTANLLSFPASYGDLDRTTSTLEPYPGIRAFRFEDRPIYFGRERQIDIAVEKMQKEKCPILLVTARSGYGKSSFVNAGVMPKLLENSVPHFAQKKEYAVVQIAHTNRDDPLVGLASAIQPYLNTHKTPVKIVDEEWDGHVDQIWNSLCIASQKLKFIVVDQMEEIFTYRFEASKLNLLFAALQKAGRDLEMQTIATIRAEYFGECDVFEPLNDAINAGHHLRLGRLTKSELRETIRGPAAYAQLDTSEVEETLVEKAHVGHALPHLAVTLRELWVRQESNSLTMSALTGLGNFEGVINTIANGAFNGFTVRNSVEKAKSAFRDVFSALVNVDLDNKPTRVVQPLERFSSTESKDLIKALADEGCRILILSGSNASEITVELAHEAICLGWDALRGFINDKESDLRELAQVDYIAKDWFYNKKRRLSDLNSRVADGHKAMRALKRKRDDLSEWSDAYLFPRDYLIALLKRPVGEIGHRDIARIGDILLEIYTEWDGTGDTRMGVGAETFEQQKQLVKYWRDVEPGVVSIEGTDGCREQFDVEGFKMARWPITQYQFRTFVDRGYGEAKYWSGLIRDTKEASPKWRGDNQPATECSWSEAVAFCRWLTEGLRDRHFIEPDREIRLPTEQEWAHAAHVNKLEKFDGRQVTQFALGANTYETNLKRTIAVGLYPTGYCPNNIEDLFGNIWEMCLNTASDICDIDPIYNNKQRIARGGSWFERFTLRRLGTPSDREAFGRSTSFGFRVVLGKPLPKRIRPTSRQGCLPNGMP